MKYFLKPLGHCLTTAVMTSAMLRLYALPAVEAATPDAKAQSPASAANPGEQAHPANLPPASSRDVAPPETLPVASSAPSPAQSSSEPEAPSTESRRANLTQPAPKPSAQRDPENDAKANSGQQVAAPQKAAPARSIAGMRQIVEKRLAAIVEQDQLRRETQWQQQMIYTVMQYAWKGQFDQARQVAQHPALSADLKAELLAKIDMIQLERQPSQVANALASQAGKGAAGAGRGVPAGNAGYSTGRSVPYSAISLGQQCPAAAPQKAAAAGTTQPTQPSAQTKMPAFVPALSQNLATQMVRLSQLPPKAAQTAKQPTKSQLAKTVLQTPEQFAGIVNRLQSPQPSPAQTSPAQAKPAIPTISTTLKAQPNQPALQLDNELRLASQPSNPTQPQITQPQITQPEARPPERQPSTQFSTIMPTVWNLDQMLGAALDQSLGQFSFSLPDWISMPISSNWDWTLPSSDPSSSSQPEIGQTQTRQLASSLLPALESLESLERSWATPQVGRDMRKLPSLAPSTPAVLAKPVTAAPQPVLYDAAALLAINCAQASLTHYSGDQVIDPAISKQMGWVNLMFPLPVAAVLTSAFGWRVHPISGTLSFHTGMDLGAPMGTPVLAAAAGQVVAADAMGGYGLAVVVEANNQRNLYAHLSGIAVEPGAQVKQGQILGWVGSTGNSTGPHLHFESQVATSSGWTTVDPIASATLAAARP